MRRSEFIKQGGFSAIELLVAMALTVTVILSVTSILWMLTKSQNQMTRTTDYYESLRHVTTTMVQDARTAYDASCSTTQYMILYGSPELSMSQAVVYRFASHPIGQPVNVHGGIADPTRLHRWEVQNGVVISDEIVGWDLVPPAPAATRFTCPSSVGGTRAATLTVFKPQLPGQTQRLQYQITGVLRNYLHY